MKSYVSRSANYLKKFLSHSLAGVDMLLPFNLSHCFPNVIRFSSAVKLLESIHPEMVKKPKVTAPPAPAPAPAPQPTKEEILAQMAKKGSKFDSRFGQLARHIPGMTQARKAYAPATASQTTGSSRATVKAGQHSSGGQHQTNASNRHDESSLELWRCTGSVHVFGRPR